MRMKSRSSTTTRPVPRARERVRRPIHPGDFLAEGLTELGLSQAEFARAIGVSPMRISHVVKGARPVTAELALLFGKAFDQSPQYWLNLQRHYDIELAENALGSRLDAVRPVAKVAKPSDVAAGAAILDYSGSRIPIDKLDGGYAMGKASVDANGYASHRLVDDQAQARAARPGVEAGKRSRKKAARSER